MRMANSVSHIESKTGKLVWWIASTPDLPITENADETVAVHRCCFRFVLVRPCTGSEQHGHDSAIARRHLAAWSGSGHTGRRDRNPNGRFTSLSACSRFAAWLPDRRKQHGVLDAGDPVDGNVRITIQL